ncbi:endonuclease/exonuclease/phosphatase family protein [Pseudoalteromonas ulvae]|uniref:Endonuclease/exonuclease/phosphatase domain-containing protein n=1 Tax=Pseudoalteromonas ulvae TaxID=107327 RepID=A0A244CMJ2_PSEDV|nr:endonuclease/exonuclease/phosphatase family protein [Pseudoalteromonas ulvae]OUL56847.1 hypothetical protein B1199_15875 [Pseudoalteromonas ulvae]
MAEPIPSPTTLRIASLNLFNYAAPPFSYYHPDDHYTALQWQEKNDWLAKQLTALNPDVIGFEEVFSIEELKIICLTHGLPYFATVTSPKIDEDDPFLFFRPVVAIASKYPFVSTHAVTANQSLLSALNLPTEFKFNRLPIKALINIPDMGPTCFYIVHLKSKRPTPLSHYTDNQFEPHSYANALINETIGRYHSDMQRTLELALLFNDVITTQANQHVHTIVMGDFNDQINAEGLGFIFNSVPDDPNPEEATLGLNDSYPLMTPRTPTHYYRGEGKVLDYILTDKMLSHTDSKFVMQYHALDQHIVNTSPQTQRISSDHALVYIDIVKK